MKRLIIFRGRKRERGVGTASTSEVVGFVRNRDEKISGMGDMSAGVAVTKREIRGRTCAT
jgi:hypothetical protein